MPHSFTLGGFRQAWVDGGQKQALINSLLVTIPTVLLSLLLASMAAFALSRYDVPLRRALLLLMLSGNLLPPQILLIPVSKLSEKLGLYDSLYALIGVQIGFGVGFYVFVLHGFMRSIPPEIQQAAVIDGAGPWQIYTRIVLPLARPALAALTALAFTWIFNDLLWAITVLRTDSKMPITAVPAGTSGAVRLAVERHRRRFGDRRRADRAGLPEVSAPLRGRTQSRSRQVNPHEPGCCAPSTPCTPYAWSPAAAGRSSPPGVRTARRADPRRSTGPAVPTSPPGRHRPGRVHPLRAAAVRRRRPDRAAAGRRASFSTA